MKQEMGAQKDTWDQLEGGGSCKRKTMGKAETIANDVFQADLQFLFMDFCIKQKILIWQLLTKSLSHKYKWDIFITLIKCA